VVVVCGAVAAPDLGLLGYLRSRRPALALVWFAHIGMDRALGLGLQYPDGSGRIHLGSTHRDGSRGGVRTG
jgi:hypothetical protein